MEELLFFVTFVTCFIHVLTMNQKNISAIHNHDELTDDIPLILLTCGNIGWIITAVAVGVKRQGSAVSVVRCSACALDVSMAVDRVWVEAIGFALAENIWVEGCGHWFCRHGSGHNISTYCKDKNANMV